MKFIPAIISIIFIILGLILSAIALTPKKGGAGTEGLLIFPAGICLFIGAVFAIITYFLI